jgi:hypothetical protein
VIEASSASVVAADLGEGKSRRGLVARELGRVGGAGTTPRAARWVKKLCWSGSSIDQGTTALRVSPAHKAASGRSLPLPDPILAA